MNKTVIMNLKKLTQNISFFTLSILLLTALIPSQSMYPMVSELDDEFDAILGNITQSDLDTLRSCEPGEAAAWNNFLSLTIDGVFIPTTLDEEFYKKTSLIRTRNILNYPEFQICSYQDMDSKHQFTWHLFYNQTTRKAFTQSTENENGNRIGSYLNIEHETFLSLIEAASRSPLIPPQLSALKNLNFPLILNNIANARLEERRIGWLAHYYQQMNCKTYFEAKLPILWMIKNLNFTDKEKQLFKDEFAAFQGSGSDFNEDEFAKQHLIFDALGTGTMELSLCTKFLERSDWSLDGGAFVFLPTDWQWARGLHGTYFEPQDIHPLLPLCDLVDNIATSPTKSANFKEILYNYFICALDHLSSDLLQCPLGYNQSLTFGLKLSPYWKVNEDLEFNGLYTIEFILPKEQKRFFVYKDHGKFSEIYAALPNSTDAESDAKLLFFEERLTSILFPRVFDTKVFPGIVFTSASNLQRSYKNWNFTAGYSGWLQTGEKFLSVTAPRPTDLIDLDFEKSIAPDAYLIKLFGKIHRNLSTSRHEASVCLWADATVFNSAIGNDFSLGISFDTKF